MSDGVIVALIAASSGIVSAAVSVPATLWIAGRKATNEDVRLGLDALKDGLTAASTTVDDLTAKLRTARHEIEKIEQQAHRVLSENNRWRLIHGEVPSISLEAFEPISDERFRDVIERFGLKK